MMIDPKKEYRTRDRRPVRILTTERRGTDYPIVGLVMDGERDYLFSWMKDGRNVLGDTKWDLVEAPIKRRIAVVWTPDDSYKTYILPKGLGVKDVANTVLNDAKAIKIIEIEEGEGME
jgi:hypothetical protein